MASASRLGLLIFLSYLILAVAQSWPLPLHFATSLTGPVGGDTGVYVWNTWVFRHELIDLHRSPMSTFTILPLTGPTDLSLHNYTVFADLLALPFQPYFGVVATFNAVYLVNVALAGFGMYLLARRMIAAGPRDRIAEAWLAGAFFACSPFLVARSTAHFSLAAAAPLPFFVYWLDRARASRRYRDAVFAGVCVAWADYSDPYYAVYCVMLAACAIGADLLTLRWERRTTDASPVARRLVTGTFVAAALLITAVTTVGHGDLHVGGASIAIHTLYTPVLLLTLLAAVRLWMSVSVHWTGPRASAVRAWIPTMAIVAGVSALLMAPELYAIARRVAEGRLVAPPVLWRSSAPGLDLAEFIVPNPNHPLASSSLVAWIAREEGRYEENVAALSWVALAVIVFAWRRASYRPNRAWTAITVGFLLLSLGPFLRIAGVQTFVPTPWALLRYMPIIGEARMPPRFAVVVTMGFGVLFAGALSSLSTRFASRRRLVLAGVAVLVAIELCPIPRTLYPAGVPSVYRAIAADNRPVRILELPFGIRDGLSSLGDFSAASQFYQTMHGKALIGGYLSRVEDREKDLHRQIPVLEALMEFSQGRTPPSSEIERATATGDSFVARANLGYVVMDTGRVSAAFRQFAIDALGLVPVESADNLELFATTPRR